MDEDALQVERLLHHLGEVVIVVEPLRLKGEGAVLEGFAQDVKGAVAYPLVGQSVAQIELDALVHVHQHLPAAREHLLERLSGEVEGEA